MMWNLDLPWADWSQE